MARKLRQQPSPPRPEFAPVGARIREERKRLGITQAKLALATKVSIGTQVGYEKGIRVPGLDYVERLRRLKFNTHYVQTGERRFVFKDLEADWELCSPIIHAISEKRVTLRKPWSSQMSWAIARMTYDYFERTGGKFDGAEMEKMLALHADISDGVL